MMPEKKILVIPSTTRRDALIAGLAGVLVLAFMVFGVMTFVFQSQKAQSAKVTGVILERQFTPAPEQEISVGGKGLKVKNIEGEFLLKVRVDNEPEPFEVPVTKAIYESKKNGDSLTFLRPASAR